MSSSGANISSRAWQTSFHLGREKVYICIPGMPSRNEVQWKQLDLRWTGARAAFDAGAQKEQS
jgi:hypothetical protein